MKSATHSAFGDPTELLSLTDSALPEPGPGQVRIRTILSPIHNHDLVTVQGQYGYKPDLPAIGGTEAVGIVDALGEGVSGVSTGQRVAVASVHGTWAEYFLAPAAGVVPVPDSVPDEAAAQMIAMPFSAVMLLEFLGVESCDWVIQNAANGAVGKMLAMLAGARGINVINLVRRDAGVEELSALGIRNAVSTAGDDWQNKVLALTGGAPIRAATDSIGGEASGDLLSLLGEDGLLVTFGALTGQPMSLPPGDLIFKQATVKGFWASKVSAAMPAETRAKLFGELLRMVADGTLKLPVEGIFPLDRITDAVTAALTPGRNGKVLLKP
ncbi:zinc-binding dehydrogenase [Paracoccus aurantiacus]|uniref:Zinc-binding dehydrogenase n=1 Tax=Paracoccus aurantiacus TaxID=2599412 RepID=A0A5C6S321_9RHOB|nr:zinc-binding dehydrogenase [Paracoccus aurantiacus]TXB69020.1 zinc-binding dehydrogenase [Paracoccus aurantiacus]